MNKESATEVMGTCDRSRLYYWQIEHQGPHRSITKSASPCINWKPVPTATGEARKELLACPFCGSLPRSQWFASETLGAEDCGYWGIDCCNAQSHADTEE